MLQWHNFYLNYCFFSICYSANSVKYIHKEKSLFKTVLKTQSAGFANTPPLSLTKQLHFFPLPSLSLYYWPLLCMFKETCKSKWTKIIKKLVVQSFHEVVDGFRNYECKQVFIYHYPFEVTCIMKIISKNIIIKDIVEANIEG